MLGLSRISRISVRRLGNVPFQDDLTPFDNESFGLADFQHYKEPESIAKGTEKTKETKVPPSAEKPEAKDEEVEIANVASMHEPLVVTSKLSNPYLNLAIEDYFYNKMPFRSTDKSTTYNRFMLYVNSPCVVIGKNQNPWKEVNLPLLSSLHIPLVRRKSGGGTVVHDSGNVNFSFMTSKQDFDRFKFAHVVVNAVNESGKLNEPLKVNERGDIVTERNSDKVSGSAYKLSRGKSYHHGTMLLTLRLDILGKLLHRDEKKLGIVDSMTSINSVRSPVTNIGLKNEDFIELVSSAFKREEMNQVNEKPIHEAHDASKDEVYASEVEAFNDMFSLSDFAASSTISVRSITIDELTQLPQEVLDEAELLKAWNWRFGSTPKFSHTLTNEKFNFSIKFNVDKHAIVDSFHIEFMESNKPSLLSKEKIISSFEFLEQVIEDGKNLPVEEKLKYTGSSIAGFVTNDMISDWIGESIDGTI